MTGTRNVVLVTIDCLRADHCGFMGYDGSTTPTLDRMAKNGVKFTNAVAPGPSTSESMPAIFTGSYPVNRPGDEAGIDARISRIRPHMRARQTLAEKFKQEGYTTGGFSPNPFTTSYFGFGSGFDTFEDFIDGSRGRLYRAVVERGGKLGRLFMPIRVLMNWVNKEEVFKPWEKYYDQVVEWTAEADRPYFLWIHLMDVHHPYLASQEYRSSTTWRNLYANWRLRAQDYEPPFSDWVADELETAYEDSIRYADAFLDRLTNDLRTDDPIYVVTSDHGESFGEHGVYEHHGGAFGEHGEQEYNSYLYEENVHVPLVISNTNRSETVTEPFSLRRLKTLFNFEGAELSIRTDRTEDFVLSQTLAADCRAIRGRRWKYINDAGNETVYDIRKEEVPLEKPELTHWLGKLDDRHERTRMEQEQIVDAVMSVAGDGDV